MVLDVLRAARALRFGRWSCFKVGQVGYPGIGERYVPALGFGFSCGQVSALLGSFLSGVFAGVNQTLQAARFVARLVNVPVFRRAYREAHCRPVQLALKNIRQRARRRGAKAQAGCTAVPEKSLSLASWAAMPVDPPRREIDLGHRYHPREELHGHPCNRYVTGFCSFRGIRVNVDKRAISACPLCFLGILRFRECESTSKNMAFR
ncbi:protein of unknown function [Burkholderia multivorans]